MQDDNRTGEFLMKEWLVCLDFLHICRRVKSLLPTKEQVRLASGTNEPIVAEQAM